MEELRLTFTPEAQEAWAWLIPAISAVASVVGNLLTNKSNKDINKEQIQNQHEILQKEQDYNTYMMQNQKQMQMSDAKQAGANPAFAQGSLLAGMTSSPSAPSVSQIPMQNPIGDAIINSLDYLLRKQEVDANSRYTSAKAEEQELLNADKKAKNNILNDEYEDVITDPHTGEVIPNDQVDAWVLKHTSKDGVQLPNVERRKRAIGNLGAEGRFEGKKALREWESRTKELSELDWRRAFDEAIIKARFADKDVVDAIKNMPRKEFDYLCEILQSQINENSVWDKRKEMIQIDLDMARTQKEIQEDSNLYQYIRKMFNDGFTWEDFGKLLSMAIVGLVQNIGSIGVGVTNLRNLGGHNPQPIRGFGR